ncbi:MAG: putative membrane protein YdjX (TVP38/TMEM64 family), partial [Gammaproteobacteria bacterium]
MDSDNSVSPLVADALIDDETDRVNNRRIWVQRGVVVAIWMTAMVLWRNYQTANDLSATGAAQEFIDSTGSTWWGILAFVGVYLARPLVLFPASLLTVVGGVLFGPVVGVIAVIIGANLSASVAFTIGRTLSAKIDDTTALDNDQ